LKDISHKKSNEMTRLHSQIGWLGQHNAELVLKNIEANTRMMDLGARQQALEEELARVTGKRDARRVAAERKAQEVEEQKETELLQKEVTVVTLSGTLQEKDKALEEKEVAIQNVEAALREKENSLSSLEEAARVQREEAQKSIVGKYSNFRCSWVLFFRS
jgi:hypothetical protein